MAAFAEGVPCWVDAMLPDVAAGKRFYGEIFGWSFGEAAGKEYGYRTQAYRDGKNVAALAPKRDGRMPTVWTVYLATPDADALTARVLRAGGRVVREPLPVGNFGTMALAADPEGAVFGLWQAAAYPGFALQQEPGSYCWAEVCSREAAEVDPFYEEVFGYTAADVPDEGGSDFRMWSPAGREPGPGTAVAGRALVGDTVPAELPAHFLVYFRVEDCDATAASVVRLGGRIRSAPVDVPPYGRMAVFADDQGAEFAVLQEL
ncbi:VOC family protein [Streptomyces physcomitrii]|uniref:VOC family protein n=1 Tax=Streptomyces physcomitrii TaxID=2724184 RepID=A0ABX1H4L5_9ACTN|nr:VOC family protein [Streptomyces physcomitrii]NKI43302.1 VOC family protein [Streptomyces physcomitrii]